MHGTTGGSASTVSSTNTANAGETEITIQPASVEIIGSETWTATVELIDPNGVNPTITLNQEFIFEFLCPSQPISAAFESVIPQNWEYNPTLLSTMCYQTPDLIIQPTGCFFVNNRQIWS